MRKLTAEELASLHKAELELLQEVDRLCRKFDIRYNIIAGTLLGAVRHGGFIPWDDDADVAMLRSEYDKFVLACREDLDTERFYFQDHHEAPGYRWGYGKLRMKNTLFLREHQEHMPYEQGVFIDVFPLDGVPDNYILRSLHSLHCFCVRKILWSAVGRVADKRPLMRLWFSLLYRIPEKAVLAHLDSMREKPGCKTQYVRILMFQTPNRTWGYRREWYEHSAPYVFEGKTFSGIRDYDAYLSFKFGRYMELPPMEQRKVHPVSDFYIREPEKQERL